MQNEPSAAVLKLNDFYTLEGLTKKLTNTHKFLWFQCKEQQRAAGVPQQGNDIKTLERKVGTCILPST